MKARILSLAIVCLMSAQNIALAQSSGMYGVSEQEIIRHDLKKLDQALAEVAAAILRRQNPGNSTSSLSVRAATAGLVASALELLVRFQKNDSSEIPANNALIKARQEILAARAAPEDERTVALLVELDKSLELIQVSLGRYSESEKYNKQLYIAGLISQAAGVVMSLYGPLMVMSSNIAAVANALSPSQASEVLLEIASARKAIAQTLASL